MTSYSCATRDRAESLRGVAGANGIDYLEVIDGPGVADADRQRFLEVHLLNPPDPGLLVMQPRNVEIVGGTRVRGIRVVSLAWSGSTLTAEVDRPGDFSVYSLRLAGSGGGALAGIDDHLSTVDFSFKIECPSEFDCALRGLCSHGGAPSADEPEIDYLARDYQGFRRLMLDRLAVLSPGWTERSAADVGVAIVEALAYSADRLAYTQDAVGMESTLATARRRTSARRHARMVDYRTHDGSNARTWVQVAVKADGEGTPLRAHTPLLTRVPGSAGVLLPDSAALREAEAATPTVFETMHAVTLYPAHHEMTFYRWGEPQCTLAIGATSATLRGTYALRQGDVLVFVEECGPLTGDPGDADPEHRHAVRLRKDAVHTVDTQSAHVSEGAVDLTEIEWDAGDALPFPLCLARRTGSDGTTREVTTARGNIVLADHGSTTIVVPGERGVPLRPYTVPPADDRLAYPPADDHPCGESARQLRAARYALTLPYADLTMAGTIGHALRGEDPQVWAAFDPEGSATAAMRTEPRFIVPAVTLTDSSDGTWRPSRDLLATNRFVRAFVVETETDGQSTVRFGDGEYGRRPRAGTVFSVSMRRGSGPLGNIGQGSIGHVVTDVPEIDGATNLVAARGGTAAESLDRTRQDAPAAFFVPERAVTPDDYARMAERHPEVQRAVATERYTGSWYTMFLSVDRLGGRPVDADFEDRLRDHLERYRMAGHDLEIDSPRMVALDVELRVCVLPDYYRADVHRALLTRLGRGVRADGGHAFFHPDEFSFGQPVTLSALLAAAHSVEGVHFAEPLRFQRRGDPRGDGIRAGELRMDSLEIARLDNDPSFPERGTLDFAMEGGR